MKPPVEAPTSSACAPRDVPAERVEPGRELGARAGHVRRLLRHLDGGVVGHPRAGLRHHLAVDAHVPAHHEALRPAARVDEPARDERDVEPLAQLSALGRGVRMAATGYAVGG